MKLNFSKAMSGYYELVINLPDGKQVHVVCAKENGSEVYVNYDDENTVYNFDTDEVFSV